MNRLYNSVTNEDDVVIQVTNLAGIPAGANPFHHDSTSMGTDLVRGWMIMHEGFDNAENPMPLTGMTLVNTRTGQRLQLDFEAMVQTYRDIVSLKDSDNIDLDLGHPCKLTQIGDNLHDGLPSVPEHRRYVQVADAMIRLPVFLEAQRAAAAWEQARFDDFPLEAWGMAKAAYDELLKKQF